MMGKSGYSGKKKTNKSKCDRMLKSAMQNAGESYTGKLRISSLHGKKRG